LADYAVNGHRVRLSTGCRNEREAIAWLRARQAEIATGNYSGQQVAKVMVFELIQDVLDQHRINGNKAIVDEERHWRLHLKPFFGNLRGMQVTTDLLRLKLLVVHDDAPTLTHSLTKRRDERRAWITVTHRQKFGMLGGCSKLLLNVHRELKRNVIVRMHSHKTRDGRVDRFKIHETEWVFQRFKFGFQVCTKPQLPRLHGGTDTTLRLA
jgi:hypothetical protein